MSLPEPSVILRCSSDDCGDTFVVTARHARRIRNGEHPLQCPPCSGRSRRKTASEKVTDAERRYWLKRFSDYDIAAFAVVIYNAPFCPEAVASKRAELMGEPLQMVASASGA